MRVAPALAATQPATEPGVDIDVHEVQEVDISGGSVPSKSPADVASGAVREPKADVSPTEWRRGHINNNIFTKNSSKSPEMADSSSTLPPTPSVPSDGGKQ